MTKLTLLLKAMAATDNQDNMAAIVVDMEVAVVVEVDMVTEEEDTLEAET